MMKKWLRRILTLCCVLALCAAACPALAEPVGAMPSYSGFLDYAMVSGTASLNLREGPSTDSFLLGSAPEGAWVGLRGESGNWYYVGVLSSGLYGYMSKNYLKLADSSGMGPSTTGVVANPKATSFLNLRQYPSYDAPVLGIYYNGTVFSLLSATADGWYQVLVNGQTGYFRKEFVTLNGGGGGMIRYTYAANGGKVNLRNAPSYTGSMVLRQLPTGTQVQVVLSSPKAAFWKVSVNGQTGYIDSQFLRESAAPSGGGDSGGSGIAPKTQGTAVVRNPKATQVLNLREQPSTSAKVIAQYRNGFKFQVIAPGETWTKVYGAASGNIGYFMTKYLKLTGVSATPTKTVSNSGSYVNLRSSPKKQAGNVAVQVPSGATVTVLIPGDEWTQVRYKGTVGYMMTYFLR